MKIILFSNSFWNFKNFRINLIDSLISNGHDVTLFAKNDNYKNFFIEKKIQSYNLSFQSRKISFLNDLFLLFKIYNIIKSRKPDVILTFTIKPNIYVSLISRLLKIKIINNITGLGSSFLNDNFIKIFTFFLYKQSISYSHKVFFQNKTDREIFIKYKIIKETNSEVIPGSGVDINYFKSTISLSKTKNIYLFSGRLLKEKGILDFLNSALIILQNNNNCEFHIIGDLYLKDKSSISLNLLNNYLVKNKKIKYFGFVKNAKKYYEQATCIILPSYREGLSKTLLEAASMSRPIITTDVPGCNDIVTHAYNGYLIKAANVESLVNAINLFNNQNYENKLLMGKNSRQIAINKFQIDLVISKYLKRINEINSN